MDTAEAVFRGEDEGLGQIVTGDDLAFFLRFFQEIPGAQRGTGVVHIENADDGRLSDRQIATDR